VSTRERITNLGIAAPPITAAWQRRALLIGGIFLIGAIIGFIIEPRQALHSWLIGFMFILGPCLGSMAMLMVWHLTGGDWGVPIRRIFEAAMGTLPLIAGAFIPVLISAYLHLNYPWSNPEEIAHSEHLRRQAAQYLSPNLFLIRAILYFIAWALMIYMLRAWSQVQDSPPDRTLGNRFRALSGAGLVVYGWTLTFATVDWVMSLDPEFTSTIYGLIFMVGQGLFAMCLAVIMAHLLQDRPPLLEVLRSDNILDYGKLMLTFVMLWAYFSFSQWLIIWSGNLPEEIHWYIDRIHGEWGVIGFILIVGHFAFPFALLLSRSLKRRTQTLLPIAVWLIVMRYIDLYWNIEPNFSKEHFHYSWLDAVIPIALFGLWFAYFLFNLRQRPLVVVHDPHFVAALEKHHE